MENSMNGILLSDSCYLRETCWKFNNKQEAECRTQNVFCPRFFRMNYLYEESLMSMKQRQHVSLRIDEDGTDLEAFNKLKNIEEHIDQFVAGGNNLYLHSTTCGNGKTAWALRMLQSYIGKIWYKSDLKCKVLFINVPRYILALKDSISASNDYIDHIKKYIFDADLVVFDEVGTKALTTWEHEQILNLVNTRIDMNKSNIYTSNLTGIELREKVGDRLYSRIMNLSIDIELFGSDKRGVN